MIFMSVGTNEAPFDRLVRAADELARSEECVVQYGSSRVRPVLAGTHDYLAFEALVDLVRTARVFVTHAGAGSVLVALSQGKRPIVVPRRRTFGEAVDDHQVSFSRRLAEAELVTLVEEPADLPAAVADAPEMEAFALDRDGLSADLFTYISGLIRSDPRKKGPLPPQSSLDETGHHVAAGEYGSRRSS